MSLGVPVPNATVTSRFAPRNLAQDFTYWHRQNIDANFFNYGFGYYLGATASKFHAGTDYAAPYGTPILASEDGLCVFADVALNPGNFAGGGYSIDVLIDGGMHYVSNHCAALLVKAGARVRRGQAIAKVGNTGNAAGIHDHFALYTPTPFRLHNPENYMAGGPYANSPLIQPASLPDTGTEAHPVWTEHVKAATGTIHFAKGAKLYSDPGKVISTLGGPSSAKRAFSLVHTDGSKWAGYVLGDPYSGLRLVSNADPNIKITVP